MSEPSGPPKADHDGGLHTLIERLERAEESERSALKLAGYGGLPLAALMALMVHAAVGLLMDGDGRMALVLACVVAFLSIGPVLAVAQYVQARLRIHGIREELALRGIDRTSAIE